MRTRRERTPYRTLTRQCASWATVSPKPRQCIADRAVRVCHAKRVHHLCCIECPVISAVVSEAALGSYCFDCAAMLGLTAGGKLLKGSAPMQKYYAQIDW